LVSAELFMGKVKSDTSSICPLYSKVSHVPVVNRIAHFLNWYVLERSPLGSLLARAASAKLIALARKCRNTDDYINLAFDFGLVGLRPAYLLHIIPTQVRDELAELAGIVDNLEPSAVLEIGTANGGTLFLWSRLASSDATVVSVDLPGGQLGGGYPKWKIPFYKSFARDKQRIWLVRGNSHDVNVFRKVRRILGTRQLDFLFVDGDHSYGGVKRDHEMYSPLVRKGGVVAFHDIVPHPLDSGCEVSKFWNEVKNMQGALEIVKDLSPRWGGIGLLYA
jgi:predicted O-methyltransferase YrrM